MKIALSCVAVLLFVATNTSAILVRRPSSFGDRYVVYGNTEFIACPAGLKCLPGEHHKTSYYLDSRRGRIKIQSNENGVSRENLYLPNGNTFIKYNIIPARYQKPCVVFHTRKFPILGVSSRFSFVGKAKIEGRLCHVWKTPSGRFTETWYVSNNEPVRHVKVDSGSNRFPRKLIWETNWRGYSTAVDNSVFKVPESCLRRLHGLA